MIIHVNSNTIRSNRKHGKIDSPLTVRETRSGKALYCDRVEICDANGNVVATVVYEPDSPLSCGAQVWIEALHEVRALKGEMND